MYNRSKMKITMPPKKVDTMVLKEDKTFTFDRDSRPPVLLSIDGDGMLSLGKENDQYAVAVIDKFKGNMDVPSVLVYEPHTKKLTFSPYGVVDGRLSGVAHSRDLFDYVVKEEGKGLSTNDYSNEDKERVAQMAKVTPIQAITVGGNTYRGDTIDIPFNTALVSESGGIFIKSAGCEAGKSSLAGGSNAKAYVNSLAWGGSTEARAHNSVALGVGTVAVVDGQVAIGFCNEEEDDALFVVGNGNHDAKKTVFKIDREGNAYCNGKRMVSEEEVERRLLKMEEALTTKFMEMFAIADDGEKELEGFNESDEPDEPDEPDKPDEPDESAGDSDGDENEV